MNCPLCELPGATLRVKDAASNPHIVHPICWREVQSVAGALARNARLTGRQVFGVPRLHEKPGGKP